MNQKEFFSMLKTYYGADVPESEQGALLISAAQCVSDLRRVLLTHPDPKMAERSCLHFLGDDAQNWWAKRGKK